MPNPPQAAEKPSVHVILSAAKNLLLFVFNEEQQMLRGVYPERNTEILRFAQHDKFRFSTVATRLSRYRLGKPIYGSRGSPSVFDGMLVEAPGVEFKQVVEKLRFGRVAATSCRHKLNVANKLMAG